MSRIRKRLLNELTKEPEERKVSLQDFAGRLLIGFFIMMLLLTVVSRGADSVTVAKITVASVKKGDLNFEVEGTGTLEQKAEKYLDLYEGVRIEDISVKEGQNIEKGDTLFQYDMNDLEDILKDLEDELKKAEINLEKDKLNYEAENVESAIQAGNIIQARTALQVAELTLERAKLDLKTAKDDLKTAKKVVNKEKKTAYEAAEKNYYEVLEVYNQQEEKKIKAIEQAKKRITEAEEVLKELYEEKTIAETVIANYKIAVESKKSDSISTAQINIMKEYYGETEYSSHQKAVKKANKVLTRVNEDYWNALVVSNENGEILLASEKASYNRAIQDASEAITELTEKDTELTIAITAYCIAIQNNIQVDITNTYATLLAFLYIEDNDRKKLIKAANKTIDVAKEALEETTKEWNKTMEKEEAADIGAQEVLYQEEKIYYQILDNTYDYSQEVKTEEKLVESAARTVEDAIRTVKDAKISLKEAIKNDSEKAVKDNTRKQIVNLNLELFEIDIINKEEAVSKINEIINNNGKVTSTVTGVLTTLGVEVGSTTSRTNKVTIALNDYGFKANVLKEEAKRLAVGDEMSIQIGNSKENFKVPIINISLEDTDGKIEITGVMPKGEYSVGAVASFKVSKRSDQYNQTIPIQALRMDAKGKYYVLTTRENNTLLGNELTAFRMDVTVLDKDYTTAAIEGSLYSEDKLIVSSNKNIKEGDRVRVKESNEQED